MLRLVLALLACCSAVYSMNGSHTTNCGGYLGRGGDVFPTCGTGEDACAEDFKKVGRSCYRKRCGGCDDTNEHVQEPCERKLWKKSSNSWKRITRLLCCPSYLLQFGSCKHKKHRKDELKCGVMRPAPTVKHFNFGRRILNGNDAHYGQFPWQVGIRSARDYGRLICGGTLIHPQMVLTAAHCLYREKGKKKRKLLQVVVGKHRKDNMSEPWKHKHNITRGPKYRRIHPDYNRTTGKYIHDLAILVLKKPVSISSFILQACLPLKNDETKQYVGRNVTVSGWGRSTGNKEVLQHGNTRVVNWGICQEEFKLKEKFKKEIGLCQQENSDTDVRTCKGDSGGGVMLYNEEKRQSTVIGVISSGVTRCPPKNATLSNALTGEHLTWLYKTMNEIKRDLTISD